MKEIFQYRLLDNPVGEYLIAFGTILLLIFIRRMISRFLASQLLGIIIQRQHSAQKQAFLSLVIKPIERFLLFFIAYTALDRLNFPDALNFELYHKRLDIQDIVSGLGVILIVIVFIQLCIRVIEFIARILVEKANLNNDKSENQLIVFFKDFFKVILIIIGFLMILRFAFNKDISSLLTGLSLVGAALALATRESLENLIASFIIFFDKPFIIGDLVKVQNLTGVVEKIGLRSTRIRTEQKTFITVPNKQMVDTILDNITLRTERKGELRLEISIATTAAKLEQVLNGIRMMLASDAEITQYYVYLMDTGRKAHIIAVDYFTAMPQPIEAFYRIQERINLNIIRLLEAENVSASSRNMEVIVQRSNE